MFSTDKWSKILTLPNWYEPKFRSKTGKHMNGPPKLASDIRIKMCVIIEWMSKTTVWILFCSLSGQSILIIVKIETDTNINTN